MIALSHTKLHNYEANYEINYHIIGIFVVNLLISLRHATLTSKQQ